MTGHMKKTGFNAPFTIAAGFILSTLLVSGCRQGDSYKGFIRAEFFEDGNLRIPVPPGFFPVAGNEARFKRFYEGQGAEMERAWAAASYHPEMTFMDPAGLAKGRFRQISYSAKGRVKMGCAQWYLQLPKSPASRTSVIEPVTLGGLDWFFMQDRTNKALQQMVSYARCEDDLLWSLHFSDLGPGSMNPDALRAFAESVAASAAVRPAGEKAPVEAITAADQEDI